MFQGRHATWQLRALPDFMIIGAQKSGTTSLFYYLSQHPQLAPSPIKGIHYFDGGNLPGLENFAKGEAWYRSHFPLRSQMRTGQLAFEASPLYLFHPLAPKRIFDLVPHVKMISILRNPTDRAISHYYHVKRHHLEPLPILDALQQEEQRLEPALRDGVFNGSEFLQYTYKSRGRYKEQLERYYEYFPREQILVLNSEEFFREPGVTLAEIFHFIGVDANYQVKDLTLKNPARTRYQVDTEVYDYLNGYFRSANHDLYALLGRDLGWG